ncbi:MAG: ATP synthase F1 subunit gamma [Oligoflexia bacterium]|nr:ATP synthase F1 subunit gamma [Oligoflexia bacterium]
MANIKALKKKIRGTKQTLKIASALKLVSGSLLAKVNVRVKNSKPYYVELKKMANKIYPLADNYTHELFKEDKLNKKTALLIISSDRGLCGNYNSQLNRNVVDFILKNKDQELMIYGIGKKVYDIISKQLKTKIKANNVTTVKKFSFAKMEANYQEIGLVAGELADLFIKKEIGRLFVAFNFFESALKFTPTVKQLLPFDSKLLESDGPEKIDEKNLDKNSEKNLENYNTHIFDLSPTEILDAIIPALYVAILYAEQLSALTAEHSARMWAMENAAKNCKEVIRKVTLKMNKLRQAAITKELIEIISGAETLKN